MKFLFIIVFAITITGNIAFMGADSKSSSKQRKMIGIVCTVIAVLFGFLDFFGAMKLTPFRHAFLLMGAVSLFQFLLCTRMSTGETAIKRRVSKIALAAFVLELTLFQITSLPTAFLGKYQPMELDLKKAAITGNSFQSFTAQNGAECKGSDSVTFTYNDVGIPVGSIRSEIEFGKATKYADLWVDMTDDTAYSIRDNAAMGRIVGGSEQTQYTSCSFSGNVHELHIEYKCPDDNNYFIVKKITLNAPIPFEVSFLRVILIVGVAALALYLAEAAEMQKPVSEKLKAFRLWAIEAVILAMTCALMTAVLKAPDGGVKNFFMSDSGDQMTEQLVDAFENGRLYIDEEVPQALLEMDNPYQWAARDGVVYEWDHLLFEGKYYSYYGIAPVILLYMPFHLITGSYMTQNCAVLLFTLLGLVFLSMTYFSFMRRFFGNIPTGCAIAGHIIMLISCGIWFSIYQPQFYQAAISSGFAATTAGAYFLISSGIFGKEKISLPRTALSSLFFGIAAMSRPTLAVYAIAAYVLYAMNIKQAAYVADGNINKKRRIIYALCGGLPLAVLGICQMVYNYARFGSPLDFGIQYSLTINDFTHSEFHLNFVFLGIFYYLFNPPTLKGAYPYISNDFTQLSINGYYYRCPETVAGLLFLAVPCIGYIFTGKALRLLPDKKSRLTAIAAVGLPFVIMPLIIICSIWESGYAVRYFADFAWEILMGALTIMFFLYLRSGSAVIKKYFRRFMSGAVVFSILLDTPIIFGVMFSRNDFPALAAAFSRVFAFWE